MCAGMFFVTSSVRFLWTIGMLDFWKLLFQRSRSADNNSRSSSDSSIESGISFRRSQISFEQISLFSERDVKRPCFADDLSEIAAILRTWVERKEFKIAHYENMFVPIASNKIYS